MTTMDQALDQRSARAGSGDRTTAAGFLPPSPPGIVAGYCHHDRLVTPGEDHHRPGLRLKWYDVRIVGTDVPAEIARTARDTVADITHTAGMDAAGAAGDTLGLVVLHVSDPITYLIIGTWRGNQELWTSTLVREIAGGAFAAVPTGAHSPNMCVWEMGPVWHERQAWVRYLRSPRDDAARDTFLADRLDGLV